MDKDDGALTRSYKIKFHFICDIHKKKVIKNCTVNPTDVTREETPWLWASNNKYDDDDDYIIKDDDGGTRTGKWMVFVPNTEVNETWGKIKEAIKEGHLWISKVSPSDPLDPTHAIMIYTPNYKNTDQIIDVLEYLEQSGIKPPDKVIKYKTDKQTLAGVYSRNKQKASIYDSKTIRMNYGKVQKKGFTTKNEMLKNKESGELSWRNKNSNESTWYNWKTSRNNVVWKTQNFGKSWDNSSSANNNSKSDFGQSSDNSASASNKND